MFNYQPPLTDMKFLLQAMSNNDTQDLAMVLEEASRFAEQALVPANNICDTIGCEFRDGEVLLPDQMKQIISNYVASGWMGITMPEEYGGQSLPNTIGSKVGEMLTSANQSFSMFPALTMSACKALMAFGSDSLKQTYLPKLVTGEWLGTMCMTEAHCGSDLGLIKTSAQSIDGETFEISGSKIFISAGEHNGSDNIIHLVLARIKDAPKGTKGLSLFLVPKFFPGTKERNSVHCIGIEEKMGIHANPTCTMSFESAKGYIVGKENEGIKAMFTMMNEMRLGTSIQGVGMSEQSFQMSYAYAIDRTQGKTLNKNKKTDSPADALIQHADIRRMLLTQKSYAEGSRALCHYCSELLDIEKSQGEGSAEATKLLGLLTPIAKAFVTEAGLESANLAIQVYGGHGFIKETGVEQIYRDGRISTLYEGTTGIQALDLLGRKVLGDQAQALLLFTKQIHQLCKEIEQSDGVPTSIKNLAKTLQPFSKEWPQLAQQIGMKAMQDHEEVGSAAYDFLMYSGYVTLAFFALKMATLASSDTEDFSNDFDQSFLSAKVKTATFYFEKMLPRTQYHQSAMLAGKSAVSELDEKEWIF